MKDTGVSCHICGIMACDTYRCNNSGINVVLGSLTSKCLCESNETHLSCTVVCLTKVSCTTYLSIPFVRKSTTYNTVETSSTGSVDYPTKLLLTEDGPGSFRAGVGTLEMDLLNSIEFLICHVPETSGVCEN